MKLCICENFRPVFLTTDRRIQCKFKETIIDKEPNENFVTLLQGW